MFDNILSSNDSNMRVEEIQIFYTHKWTIIIGVRTNKPSR